jgi:acyl carrier protein
MYVRIAEASRERIRRGGTIPLSTAESLVLFDRALAHPDAMLVPARLDIASIRARGDAAPRLFRACAPPLRRVTPSRSGAATTSTTPLRERLAALSEAEAETVIAELVHGEVAAVLGFSSAKAIKADRPLRDLGLDSLSALELRNRLGARTGLPLPATLAFDHPTPARIAARLRELLGKQAATASPVIAEFDKLDAVLSGIAPNGAERAEVTRRLRGLLARFRAPTNGADAPDVDADASPSTTDDLFRRLDEQLNRMELDG